MKSSGFNSILVFCLSEQWLYTFEKCAGLGNAANTDNTDIIFPHPHADDLDRASDTKFPLEFPPPGPFSPVDFQGLILAPAGFMLVQDYPVSRHPISVKRGKSERRQVSLQLAFT